MYIAAGVGDFSRRERVGFLMRVSLIAQLYCYTFFRALVIIIQGAVLSRARRDAKHVGAFRVSS